MVTPKLEALDDDDEDLDDIPLIKRRRPLISRVPSLTSSGLVSPSNNSLVGIAAKRLSLDHVKEWPGVPRGVKFCPSDEDLLWHLLAKVGKGNNSPHPFIDHFIACLDDVYAFGHIHPEKLPGIKRDGSESFFFHKTFKTCNSLNEEAHVKGNTDGENLYWHETGESKQFLIEGKYQCFKKKMMMCMITKEGQEPVATDWVMHQYHLGSIDDSGEFAVSRMFYELRPHQTEKNINKALEVLETIGLHGDADIAAKSVELESDRESLQDEIISEKPNSQIQDKSSGSSLFPNIRVHNRSMTSDFLQNVSSSEANNGNDGIPWHTVSEKANLPVSQMLRLSCEYGSLSSGSSVHLVNNIKEVASEAVLANKIFESEGDTDLNVNGSCSPVSYFNDGIFTKSHSLENISYPNDSQTPTAYSQEHLDQNHLGQVPISNDKEFSQRLNMRSQESVLSCDAKMKTEPLEQQFIINNVPAVEAGEITNFTRNDCSSSGDLLKASTSGSFSGFTFLSSSSPKDNTCQENILSHCNSSPEGTQGGCSSPTSLTEKFLFGSSSTNKSPDLVFTRGPAIVKSENLDTHVKNRQSTSPHADFPFAEVNELLHGPYKDVTGVTQSVTQSDMSVLECLPNFGCNNKRSFPKEDNPINYSSASEKTQGNHFPKHRKRKRTATNSVGTALEEDAPGLLQVLLDKGITISEMKLYGSTEEEALYVSSEDENFDDLEYVMNKLFPIRSSLPKLSVARFMKESKAIYCLSCLISLIEQARYLQFCLSPVEWGWCRDLQSFIFVFQSHNRIVVERPEYGYATYFFELIHSLPVEWQLKRLVIAMKLASCGRSTLLENKPLLVGKDLTEGEARILEEYGWTPNCGLGTMLNYRDRVVHDKKYERFNSEWRAKIGKLLMDGHDGGRTELANFPKRAAGCMQNMDSEIKLEY